MKELSIEDKAKAYDEAKLRMIAAYNSNRCTIGFMNEIFPELKESEDERIRKHIIEVFRDNFSGEDTDKCIAWLEKQGEYKSTDKVEPKFKVNELVVTGINDVVQIKAVNNGHYTIDNGMEFNMPYVDRYWHKWTIEDAKDGNVLAIDPWSDYPSSFVAIYKKQNEENFDSYCFVGFDGKFYKGENGHSVEDIHPATKEQLDTLMKAMADAGYTFDFDKKELKKIVTPKFKIGDKVYSLKNGFECTIESIDETTYYGDTTNFDIKDQNNWKLVEHNPAWSEEDEDYINDLIRYFSQNEILENTKEDIVCWLESLRPKNTWKPSDDQLNSLKQAISVFPYETDYLELLYDDLKKLKGCNGD